MKLFSPPSPSFRDEGSSARYGRQDFFYRYIIIAVFFAIVCFLYIFSAIRVQITTPDENDSAAVEYITRRVTIPAVRGEIYDRNGNILVSNEYTYSLIFDYSAMANSRLEQNNDLLSVIAALGESEFRAENQCPLKGIYPQITYDVELLQNSTVASRLERIISELELEENASAQKVADAIAAKYMMIDSEDAPRYSDEEMTALIRVRYEMEAIRFSKNEPYVFARNIDMAMITRIRELGIRGTEVTVDYARVYHYPGYASHILGRISKLLSDNVDHYTSQGYPITAKVGISGCELAFEQYLRGIDGEMTVTEDLEGNIVSTEVTKEPVIGQDIYLTIDIFLQIAAEKALAENIAYVANKGANNAGDRDGEDCNAGAIVVQSASGGEILAIGSYPTYNLSTYNADFSDLVNDPRNVYTNRALMGQYRPGSTAKIGMSVAALAEPLYLSNGTLFTENTKILTKGIYTYYDDYQPVCWLWDDYKTSHGSIDVAKAISVSCNYFYFEIGRLMGIERINRYFSILGLGQPTGVELGENLGILADAEYKKTLNIDISDRAWMPGDTLRSSIGVGYSEHTPLQISNYIASVINGGTRYSAHLLYEVRSFSGDTVYSTTPTVISEVSISDSAYNKLVEGMEAVLSSSSVLKEAFSGFPKEIGAGGKTGTAQTSSSVSSNAVFVSFAPLNDPEIVVACVLERGANGYNASFTARAVFDHYFKLTEQTANN